MRWILVAALVACSSAEPERAGEVAPATSVPPQAPDALEIRRKALSAELRELVGELELAGRYDCCIETPCKLCAVRAGGCRCGEAARDGEPVCEECAMMWSKGLGDEPVPASSIRSFLEAERQQNGDICGKPPVTAE